MTAFCIDYKTDAILRRELSKKNKRSSCYHCCTAYQYDLTCRADHCLKRGKRLAGIGTHQEKFDHCAVYRENQSFIGCTKLKVERRLCNMSESRTNMRRGHGPMPAWVRQKKRKDFKGTIGKFFHILAVIRSELLQLLCCLLWVYSLFCIRT